MRRNFLFAAGVDRQSLLLRLPAPPALLRWHVHLAEQLFEAGHILRIEWGAGNPLPSWMGWLRLIEQTLYASRAIGRQDMLATAQPDELPRFGEGEGTVQPDLCIDCTDGTLSDAGPTLRPGITGGAVEQRLLADVMEGRAPAVGWRAGEAGRVVAQGRAGINSPHIHTESVSQALARMVTMAEGAIANLREGGKTLGTASLPAGALGAARAVGLAFAGRVAAAVETRLRSAPQWRIGWREIPVENGILATGRFDPGAFNWLPPLPQSYLADPFVHVHNGIRAIFVEEMPYATGRGIISVLTIGANGEVSAPIPVLELPHHLSFPCVFEHGGTLWMMPEGYGGKRLDLFRCERFPDTWVHHATLMEGDVPIDPIFFEHDGLCWIAGSTAGEGASDKDALALFYAPTIAGPWRPHARNPVVVDAGTARPGGAIQRIGGRMRRPGQDCTQGYGRGVAVLEIDELTPESYAERLIATIPAPASFGATAFHTVNWSGGIETVDAILTDSPPDFTESR